METRVRCQASLCGTCSGKVTNSKTCLASEYIGFTVSTSFHQCSVHVRASTVDARYSVQVTVFKWNNLTYVRSGTVKCRTVGAQCVAERAKRATVRLAHGDCLPAFVDMAWGRPRRTSVRIVNVQGEACKQDLAKTKQQPCTLDQESWYEVCRKQTINRALCVQLTQLLWCECSEIQYTNWRGQVRSPSSGCFFQNFSNYMMIFTL